jgi:hypothetical protein
MFLMHQRSADRPQGERLESSRDISWGREIKFYLSMAVLAQILYFGGSEGLIKYQEWLRACTAGTPTTPNTTPVAPTITPQQQLQKVVTQARQQTHQQLIYALTTAAQSHPEQKSRDQAIQSLQQLGVNYSLPSQPIVLARGKG